MTKNEVYESAKRLAGDRKLIQMPHKINGSEVTWGQYKRLEGNFEFWINPMILLNSIPSILILNEKHYLHFQIAKKKHMEIGKDDWWCGGWEQANSKNFFWFTSETLEELIVKMDEFLNKFVDGVYKYDKESTYKILEK